MTMIAFLFVIAGPVILIWGVIRYLFSGAVEVASQVTGSQGGVAFGDKNRKRGSKLILIGLVLSILAIAWFMFAP